jgi:transposase
MSEATVKAKQARQPTPAEERGTIVLALLEGRISVQEAARKLGKSVRQVYRIKARARERGVSLRHGNEGRTPANKIAPEIWNEVIELARTVYAGIPYYELQEILLTEHSISVGRESLRKKLRAAGIPSKRDSPKGL